MGHFNVHECMPVLSYEFYKISIYFLVVMWKIIPTMKSLYRTRKQQRPN
jgi:hypothetical protein